MSNFEHVDEEIELNWTMTAGDTEVHYGITRDTEIGAYYLDPYTRLPNLMTMPSNNGQSFLEQQQQQQQKRTKVNGNVNGELSKPAHAAITVSPSGTLHKCTRPRTSEIDNQQTDKLINLRIRELPPRELFFKDGTRPHGVSCVAQTSITLACLLNV